MANELPPFTDAQLEIMDVARELREAGVAQVRDQLAASREIARNTVQTQLTGLESKGWLDHEDRSGGFVERAASPRKSDVASAATRMRGLVTGMALVVGMAANTLVACTPNHAITSPTAEDSAGADVVGVVDVEMDESGVAVEASDASWPETDFPRLDPVLARLGFDKIEKATLEFVWDHGGHGDVFRLADGRKIPSETEWIFDDPLPVLNALAQAKSVRFDEDSWPAARAEFCLYGDLPDGRRVQISFHAQRGAATVSRSTTTDRLEGGEWRFQGAENELIQLMRNTIPSMVEVPLKQASVWWVPSGIAPEIHGVRVLRSAAEVALHLELIESAKEGKAALEFDFERGLVVCVQSPATDPFRELRWGTPVLRNGNVLEQLVFESKLDSAEAGWAAVMLLFIEVPDPAAIDRVVVNLNGKSKFTRRLE